MLLLRNADWRKYLRIHPAAELFPLMKDMDPAGFRDLVEDIRAHGLAEPIVGWASNEGQFVLDGRNRLDALAQLGLLYETDDHHVGIKKWTGSEWSDKPGDRIDGSDGAFRTIYEREGLDPYEIVISLNVHRRHLTPKLKRELIANVLKAKPELSDRAIGRLIGSDHKTVGDIRSNGEISHKPTDEANSNIPTDRKSLAHDAQGRLGRAARFIRSGLRLVCLVARPPRPDDHRPYLDNQDTARRSRSTKGSDVMIERRRLPNRRRSETFDLEVVGLKYKVTISRFPDGAIAECFISNHKAGNASDVAARDAGILLSLLLQHGHTHRRRRHSERALWPDTTMASAFLIALTKWAIAHHNDADAKITLSLSVGVVGAEELMNVLHALEKARQRTGYVASPHPND